MSAFHKAVENNIPFVEFDVWMTKDKIPIVIHGGDHGEIEYESEEYEISSKLKIDELSFYQIEHIFLPNGEHIPTLNEMMDEFKGKFTFVLDLKEPNPDILKVIIDFLIEKKFYDKFIIYSYIPKQMELFTQLAYEYGILSDTEPTPFNVKIGYVYFEIGTVSPDEYATRGSCVAIDAKMTTKEIVDNIQRNGREVGWYFYPAKEETEEIYNKLLSYGVDYIISDNPEQLREYLKRVIKIE